jgi:hypothetical protein
MFFDPFAPGPCVVCGEPYGACTPESVAAKQAQRQAAKAVEPTPTTFTTATYQRAVHGRKRPAPKATR